MASKGALLMQCLFGRLNFPPLLFHLAASQMLLRQAEQSEGKAIAEDSTRVANF